MDIITRIAELQKNLPWNMNDYTPVFLTDLAPHRDYRHALLHLVKASALLYAGPQRETESIKKRLADLVIVAVRMANTHPLGSFPLDKKVLDVLFRSGCVFRLPDEIRDVEIDLVATCGLLAITTEELDHPLDAKEQKTLRLQYEKDQDRLAMVVIYVLRICNLYIDDHTNVSLDLGQLLSERLEQKFSTKTSA